MAALDKRGGGGPPGRNCRRPPLVSQQPDLARAVNLEGVANPC